MRPDRASGLRPSAGGLRPGPGGLRKGPGGLKPRADVCADCHLDPGATVSSAAGPPTVQMPMNLSA